MDSYFIISFICADTSVCNVQEFAKPTHLMCNMKANVKPLVNGHRKQLRVTEYQQNCFLCLAFIDAR